jgi:hypothetical protein
MMTKFGASQGDLRDRTRKAVLTNRQRMLRAQFPGWLYTDKRDYRDTIFLAGSGRSGTTWVSEVINYRNQYRYIFEPFYPGRVRTCRGLNRKQYLRPEDRREEFLRPARIILSGGLKNHYWADFKDSRFLPRWRLVKDMRRNKTRNWGDKLNGGFIPGRRLIKEIRANLMLGWLRANFPEMPIVFLLRHPCAVVHSKMKLGWSPNLDDFLLQEELMEDFLWPFENEMRSARTDFERHVFLWCVENYVPLKQLTPGEVYLIFYENLCADPEGEVKRMFGFLNKYFNESVLERIKKPSLLSRRESAIHLGEGLVGGWRKHVTGAQLLRAVEILGLFGMHNIYSEQAVPNAEGTRVLMESYRDNVRVAPGGERKGFVA